MNRFVTLPLILLFMLGPMRPHSHAGGSGASPIDHAFCNHVHLRTDHRCHSSAGHHCHHASERLRSNASAETEPSTDASVATATEHDADAIYIADVQLVFSRPATKVSIEHAVVGWAANPNFETPSSSLGQRLSEPPERPCRLRIYLFLSSLLI